MGDKFWFALVIMSSVVVGLLVVFVVAPYPLEVGVVLAAVVVLWWFCCRLDWWQKFYALTLALMVGATTTIPQLVAFSGYTRYAAAGGLLIATWLTTRKTVPIQRGHLQQRFYRMLWFTVVLAGVSTIWSEAPSDTAQQTVALAFLVGTMHLLTTRRWTNRSNMAADFRAGMTVINTAFLVSITTLFIGYSNSHTVVGNRFQGIFNNPNLLGLIAAVSIPILWSLHREQRNPLRLLTLAPAVAVLVLTESRTAMAAVAVAFLWTVVRSSGATRVAVGLLGVLALLIMWAGKLTPFDGLFERFSSVEGGGALNGRALAWYEAIELIFQQPLGYGWQAGRQLFESMQGAAGFAFTRTSVHNSYLQFLLELGLLAVVPLFYFLITFALIVWRGESSKLSTGLIGTIVAGCLVQVTESAMFGTGQPYPYIFWFAVAGALTVYRSKAETTKDPVEQKRKNLPDAYKRMKLSQPVKASTGGTGSPRRAGRKSTHLPAAPAGYR